MKKRSKELPRISPLKVLLAGVLVLGVVYVAIHVSHVVNILEPMHMKDEKNPGKYTSSVLQTKDPLVPQSTPKADHNPSVSTVGHDPVIPSLDTPIAPVVPTDKPKIKVENKDFKPRKQSNHMILDLSDKDFMSIDVGTMMSWYGEALGGGTCAHDFGNELVVRWRNAKASYCKPPNAADGSTGAEVHSSIDCYHTLQTRHHGTGDNLCVMKNVGVQFGLFGDDAATRTVVKRYVDTTHADQPYIHFNKGFVQGDCKPHPAVWHVENFPGWNEDWTTKAFEEVPDFFSASNNLRGGAGVQVGSGHCDEWVEHPVIITQRDTFANFFHDSEDFINMFLAMAILNYTRANTQIYLTDLYPKGPFWDIWGKSYSGAYPVLDAWDLRKTFGTNKPRGKDHRVCFKEIAVSIYGPAAPVTVASWDTPCHHTALVTAYADFIVRGMNLQEFTRHRQARPSNTVVVTYLARRASSEWPEKRFCDSENSFFLCDLWATFGIRQLGRMVRNDDAVVGALKTLATAKFSNGATVKFQDVDFNLLTLEEQIKVDLDTDIMIGPHGAGLMHSIFLPDRATLIEMHIDASGANRHFHNLALWSGHHYITDSRLNSNPINIQDLLSVVRSAVERINLST